MSYINLDVPHTEKKPLTLLEKVALGVCGVAVIALVAVVCMGSTSNLGAPTATRSLATMPRVSPRTMGNRMSLATRAQQVSSSAAALKRNNDGRLGKIAFLAVPVAAWVGYNILGPAQNQLDEMTSTKKGPAKKARRRAILSGIASAAAGAAVLADADADEVIKAIDEISMEQH
ncbi:hypothetical protein AAMO2058_001388800 [Amorphochlora amoebiformis]